jgi:hypothetical protein
VVRDQPPLPHKMLSHGLGLLMPPAVALSHWICAYDSHLCTHVP